MRLFHAIGTRFNVPWAGGPQASVGDDWLRARLSLFREFTVPSVRRQSAAPELWCLFVSEASPSWLLRELGTIQCELDKTRLKVVLVHGAFTGAHFGRELASAASANVLLTTRLDNDDALATSYSRVIRSAADNWLESTRGKRQDGGWGIVLNARLGYQCGKGQLAKRRDPASPFITLVESPHAGQVPLSVYGFPHHTAHDAFPVRQLGSRPLWLQTIHESNLANRMAGIPTRRFDTAEFPGLEAHMAPVGPPAFAIRWVSAGLRLSFRTFRSARRWRWLLRTLST